VFTFLGVANNEYEIENILFDETFGNKKMYLVKWKYYPMDQCTWEPYRNLTNCQELLTAYRANKIVSSDIYKTDAYTKLYSELNDFADQELLESLHHVVDEGIPIIEKHFILGTIAYLSTLAPNNRSQELVNLIRHNLLLIEVKRKRRRQMEKLERWQKSMQSISGLNISVVNNVDYEGPPKKFIYVNECVAGTGVVIPNDPPIWYVKL
jgi:histone-lysine N-methyltransferase SUV39H